MEEAVRRNIVIGFFDTVYWSRRFKRERAARSASRMGGPPQMAVPEIFVEDPDDSVESKGGIRIKDFPENISLTPPRDGKRESSTSSYEAGRSSSVASSLRRRESRSNSPVGLDRSPNAGPHLAADRQPFEDTSYHGAAGVRRSQSPTRLVPSHSRQGSSVSALGVLDSLDNSAWGESIRRSFTMRRPNSSAHP